MKKIILLILAFGILVNSAAPCVLAKETEPVSYAHEVQILKGLGLLEVLEEETGEDVDMTRGGFVSMVINLIDEQVGSRSYDIHPFVDLSAESAEYPYFCEAYMRDIIHGSDGYAYPKLTITYIEAVRILVDVLGYNLIANDRGGYPSGYMYTAKRIGLADVLDKGEEDKLTVGEASALFYQALMTNMLDVQSWNVNITATESNYTLLETAAKIVKDTGILNENTYTSVDAVSGNDWQWAVSIGDFTGYIYKSLLSEKYLGYCVDYFYRKDSKEILYIEPSEEINEIIEVSDEEIIGFSFANRLFTYQLNHSSATKNKWIASDVSVIINGKNKPKYEETDLTPEYGMVVLVDNDGDGDIDVIRVSSYISYLVGSINQRDKVIVDYIDNTKRLDLSETVTGSTALITDAAGNVIDFDSLAQFDVVTAMVSEDQSYIRAMVSKEAETLKIVSIKELDSGDPEVTLSDGNSYKIIPDMASKHMDTFPMGKTGTIYFDVNGRIVAFQSEPVYTGYGLYIRAAATGTFSETYLVKILDVYGVIQTLKASDKFKVDGMNVKAEKRKGNDIFPTKACVVLYQTNGENELISMDTEYRSPEEESNDTLRSIYGDTYLNVNYYPAFKAIKDKLWVNEKTIFFFGPSDPSGASDDDYSVGTMDNLRKKVYLFKGYNLNEKSVTPDVVHVDLSASTVQDLSSASKISIITDIVEILNDKGEKTTQISMVDANGTADYNVSTRVNISDKVANVHIGDFVLYNLDARNEITNIDYVVNSKREVSTSGDVQTLLSSSVSYFSSLFQLAYGYALIKEGDLLGLSKTYPTSNVIPENLALYKAKKACQVFLVDTTRQSKTTVTQVSWDDIKDHINYGEADFICAYINSSEYFTVAIYR